MEEIDLVQLFRYYLKKSPIIILTTILAILIGYLYVEYIQIPMYHGSTTIILVQNNDNEDSFDVTQNELTVNEKLVSTYSEIIRSRRVLEQVIENLKLKTSTADLADRIEVSSVSETYIIKVTVSDKSNKKAVEIANEVAEVFKKEISDIYNLENVSTVDKAIVEKKPYNVNKAKYLVIFALAGIVLSSGVIFVIYYFDNTIKNKKEIEEKLQLAVLGEIPVAKKLDKKSKRRKNKKKKRDKKLENNNLIITDNKKVDDIDEEIIEPKEEVKKVKKTTTRKSNSKKASTAKSDTKKTTTKSNTSKSSTKKKNTKESVKQTSKEVEGGDKDEGINS